MTESELLRCAEELRDRGELKAAESTLLEMVERFPENPVAWFKLGTVHEKQRDPRRAEAAYQRAIELRDVYPDAINNLALLAMRRSDYEYAEVLLRGLLGEHVDYVNAHINLGNTLLDTGRAVEAQYYFRRATLMDPASPVAHGQLGLALRSRGRNSEGIRSLLRAVELAPENHSAWNDLGTCYFEGGEHELADSAFARSLALNPDQKNAWHNWLFLANFMSLDRGEIYSRHVAYGRQMEKMHADPFSAAITFRPLAQRRLRIGLVSGDLRRHSVCYFIMAVLEPLRREGFDVYAYSTNSKEDALTETIKTRVKEWRSLVGLDDSEATEVVRRDRIDILFDLSGHTNHNRLELFYQRMAPLQVAWIGYPNTTGLPNIDYRITDSIADPVDDTDQYHTETLIRLQPPFLCFSTPGVDVPVVASPMIASAVVTFGSFNARVKIGDECIRLWSRVLHAVPGSRMMIKSSNGLEEDAAKESLRKRFVQLGIVGERIEIHGAMPDDRTHLELYGRVDICLDAYPYNGTTTTCEALWMGVPVITLAGDRHASRVGATLLSAVGLQNLVAKDPDQFIDIARQLALDAAKLDSLRRGMRQRLQASPLLDAPACAAKLAGALREVWQRHIEAAGCIPGGIHLTPDPERNFGAMRLASGTAPDGAPLLGFRLAATSGITHVVPVTPRSMSTYVLLEQRRWFEPEVDYLSRVVSVGDFVIDIGANVGAYALPLAKCVGAQGRVVAYEPAAVNRAYLQSSLIENGLINVDVRPLAVSDRVGQTELIEGDSGEFHSIRLEGAAGDGVSVQTTTLDAESEAMAWESVALIKIDAEGAEQAILAGGAQFFARYSPLVMFEIKNADKLTADLRWTFLALGYSIYRLAGDDEYLVPAGPATPLDSFVVNLFAAKPETAARLAARGLLIEEGVTGQVTADVEARALESSCGTALFRVLEIEPKDIRTSEVAEPLTAFAVFRDRSVPTTIRHGMLCLAIETLEPLERDTRLLSRTLTLARLQFALGARARGLLLLKKAMQLVDEGVSIEEPFWPVLDRYLEKVDEAEMRQWFQSQVVEAYEIHRAFSSYCSEAYMDGLRKLALSDFASDEIRRRLILVAARDGLDHEVVSPFLGDGGKGTPAYLWSAVGFDYLSNCFAE